MQQELHHMTLNMNAPRSFQMSGTDCPMTQHHIPQDHRPHQQLRESKMPLVLKCITHNSVQHMQTTNLSVLQQNVLILFITVYVYPDCGARTSRATEPDDNTGAVRKQQPDALQQNNVTALLSWSNGAEKQERNKGAAHI